jgi:hypothetical protein
VNLDATLISALVAVRRLGVGCTVADIADFGEERVVLR